MMGRIWRAMLQAGSLRMWAMFGAGIALTGFSLWLVWLIRNGWPADRAQQQLWYLGTALLMAQALIGVIVVALASVKASGRLPGGVGFDIDGENAAARDIPIAPPPAKQTVTTTVETKT